MILNYSVHRNHTIKVYNFKTIINRHADGKKNEQCFIMRMISYDLINEH